MATSNQNATTSSDAAWWRELLQDPNFQNAIASGLTGEIQQDATSQLNAGLNEQANIIRNAMGSNTYNMPAGMNFGPYLPLLKLIGDTSYSRENAIADTQGFIDELFRSYQAEALPQIYRNPRASGIYNDTSTQLLANDAYATTVSKGMAALSQNILNYAQARQAQLNPVMQLMQGQVSNSNQLISAQAGLEQQRMAGNVNLAGLLAGNAANRGMANAQASNANNTNNITTGISAAQTLLNMYDRYQKSQQGTQSNDDITNSYGGGTNTYPDDTYQYDDMNDWWG